MYSIFEIAFGLLALALPVAAAILCGNKKPGAAIWCCFGGLACAVLCMLAVIAQLAVWVEANDWSALLDTISAYKTLAAALAVLGIALGGAAAAGIAKAANIKPKQASK